MTQAPKLKFSRREIKLVSKAKPILTKRKAMQKVVEYFSQLAPTIAALAHQHHTPILQKKFETAPKITKGENYNGLPYVVLDYPAIFGKNGIFALRTIFIWGKGIIVHLHVSGIFLEEISIAAAIQLPKNIYSANEAGEWEHWPKNKQQEQVLVFPTHKKNPFIKLNGKIKLKNFGEDKLWKTYEKLFSVLTKITTPSDGTTPSPGIPKVGSGP